METDAIECYCFGWATDDLQPCVNHVVKNHGDKLLKVKTRALDEKYDTFGMKSKNFGFIPNDTLEPGQYLIANPSNLTVTLQDKTNDYDDDDNGDEEEDDHDEEMDFEDGILLNFLEKSLQNLSIDIEKDGDTFINSPLAKKAKCSTPLTKVSDRHTKLNEHDNILDEMIMIMPNVLNEMKRNGHLKTWISLSRMVNDGSFSFDDIAFLLFMDVCRFLSSENTSGIRYSDKVKHFWRIGYRLFKLYYNFEYTEGPMNL